MVNAFDERADFLRSEKDLRPHYETDRRGMFMPIMRNGYNNALSLAMPEALGGHGASVMSDIVQGKPLTQDEVSHGAQGAANFMFTGGLAGNIGKRPSAGVASMFGGTSSKTADMGMHNRANLMESAGAPREQIWKDTGWFKGVDGKWRNEIDDGASGITAQFRNERSGSGQWAPNALVHDDLYKAYPDTKSLFMQKQGFPGGAFDEMTGTIHAGGSNGGQLRSTALHEMQHAVQGKEGFASGGAGAETNYNALAGEVEARAVQARMDLTPAQRRARPPWLDYDVPEAQQIVRFGSDGPQMSSTGAQPPKNLPMDQASRMQRAREMGFDEGVVYHGTHSNNIDAFSGMVNGSSVERYQGNSRVPQIHTTTSKGEAELYGPNVMELMLRGNYTNIKQPHKQAEALADKYEKKLMALEQKDHDISNEAWRRSQRLLEALRDTEMPYAHTMLSRSMKKAKKEGADGVTFAGGFGDAGAGRHFVAFDPRNIRSVDAAFDPTMRDSANLLAANPATGAAIPLAGNAFEEQRPSIDEMLRRYDGAY